MKNQNIENIFSAVEKLCMCSRYEEKRTCKHVLGIFLTHSFYQSKGFIYFCGMSLSHSDRSQDQGPLREIWWFFRESIKQKLQSLQQICFHRQKTFYLKTSVLQKGTSSRCVLFIHRPRKHDLVIYGAAKVKNSRKIN